jgi:hypothetical protein
LDCKGCQYRDRVTKLLSALRYGVLDTEFAQCLQGLRKSIVCQEAWSILTAVLLPLCSSVPIKLIVLLGVGCVHVRILALQFELDNNLTLGYIDLMSKATGAARELAKRSVAVRRRMWGEEGFRERMQKWGKLGGRPRKGGA